MSHWYQSLKWRLAAMLSKLQLVNCQSQVSETQAAGRATGAHERLPRVLGSPSPLESGRAWRRHAALGSILKNGFPFQITHPGCQALNLPGMATSPAASPTERAHCRDHISTVCFYFRDNEMPCFFLVFLRHAIFPPISAISLIYIAAAFSFYTLLLYSKNRNFHVTPFMQVRITNPMQIKNKTGQ